MNELIRRWTLWVLVLLCLLGGAGIAHAEDAADYPQFQWEGYTLYIRSVSVNPVHIVDNPSPETNQYFMIHLKCVDDPVPTYDLVQALESFKLVNDAEEAFPASAFMPYCIVYGESNGVFMTAGEQSMFDLFFVVPVGNAPEDLSLEVDGVYACDLYGAEIIEGAQE